MAFSFMRKLRYGKPIVVVSGLPRSGTSMSMKMLEAGGVEIAQDGLREADEDNPKGYYELERVKELDKGGDKTWLKDVRGQGVKIISFLLPELPDTNNYKILFMRRHIDEVLASQQKMLDRRGEENKTEDDRMKDLYEKHLSRVDVMLRTRECFESLDLPYREILEDGAGFAKRIAEFLELPLDVEKMTGVVDKALYRNRA